MPRPRVLRSTPARLSIRPAIGGLRQCWRCVVICNGVSPIRSSALGSQLPAERLVPVVSNRIKLCQRADEPQDAARQGNGEVHVYLSIPLSACAPLKTTWHGWPTPATRRAGQELGGPSSACRLPARTQRNANSMPILLSSIEFLKSQEMGSRNRESVGSARSAGTASSRPISTNSSDPLNESGAPNAQPSWETVFPHGSKDTIPHSPGSPQTDNTPEASLAGPSTGNGVMSNARKFLLGNLACFGANVFFGLGSVIGKVGIPEASL